MSLTKSSRFPNRVEKRRRTALVAREADVKKYTYSAGQKDLPEEQAKRDAEKLANAQAEVILLKKKLRIKE